jgi:TldD protein
MEDDGMGEIERREFLKLTGTGLGVIAASSLFHDKLLAGTMPTDGATVFEERFGVSQETMRKVLGAALSKGGDFAELYLEYRVASNVKMEDDILKESNEDISLGVGIRVLNGKQTGFGYSSDLNLEKMEQAAHTAAAIAAAQGKASLPPFTRVQPDKQVYLMAKPLAESPLGDKIALVTDAYKAALAYDQRIKKVTALFADELQYVTIANSEGLIVSDTRPQARLFVFATAEANGVRVTGSENAGGRVGATFYASKGSTPKEIGVGAAEEAIILLSAVNPAPGDQPVECGNKNSGVMVHEAVGHPFEGDGIWQKTSIMHDRLGQMVANPIVTIYDDATIPHYRGSMNIDDEGTLTRNVVMVEKGKLTSFLHDRLSARLTGVAPNGHGRRQSFRHIPIPRMNNTVLAPGSSDPEEIIKSVKKGFYAHSYQGGEVQDTGKFTFSVNLGYLIEDGKLTAPVKNATLIGTNLQILREIEMIGNDLAFFLGTCGKSGQGAPVTAGTPTFKIRQMTVGGRA